MSKTYDFAIVGAGVSGLTMAWLLTESSLAARSILLIDGARDDEELRSLSFWSPEPMPLESLIAHRWSKLGVQADTTSLTLPISEHTYRTLFFADLQRATKARLGKNPAHQIHEGRVRGLVQDPEGVTLTVGDATFRARWVLDSRFRLADLVVDDQRWHSLRQYFHGWIVRASHDAFDPTVATLLDFRTETRVGTGFFYVLPFSPREALVELVSLDPVEGEPMMRSYLSRVFGIQAPELLQREAGVSPMTEQPFAWQEGHRVRHIGIAAGRLKASTGYALTRIVEDCARVVRSLERDGHPAVPPHDAWFYRILDGILLEVWSETPEAIPPIFAAMFAGNPADRVLRFLDERTSLWEVFCVVLTLPKLPFLRAALRWARRWLSRLDPPAAGGR